MCLSVSANILDVRVFLMYSVDVALYDSRNLKASCADMKISIIAANRILPVSRVSCSL